MIPDDQALALHDRATRGQPLSTEERTLLEGWYVEQDRAEALALRSSPPPESVVDIQRELSVVLAQLIDVSQRIKEIVSQNEAIRRENAALRQQVALRFAGEVA